MAPQVQQAYGLEPQTAQGQIETSYLLFLGFVFVVIILEGLFIAISVSTASHIDPISGCYKSCCISGAEAMVLHLHWHHHDDTVQGFLPEAADQFAQDVVYPSFSPSVGFFLLLSTAYGIWKVCTQHKTVKLCCIEKIQSDLHMHEFSWHADGEVLLECSRDNDRGGTRPAVGLRICSARPLGDQSWIWELQEWQRKILAYITSG